MDKDNAQDKFQIFFTQVILRTKTIPPIIEVKPYFEKLTKKEFIDVITKMLADVDRDVFQMFLYYILLFRDLKNLQDFLNDPDVSLQLIEKLIFFTYGHCLHYEFSSERILDEFCSFIKPQRLLEIVTNTPYISKDKQLLLYILTKLDQDSLKKYFDQIKNIDEFLLFFIKLPDNIMRSIIARNYRLFQYIMVLSSESISIDLDIKKFYKKYISDIEQFSRLGDFIKKYRLHAHLDSERELPMDKRDSARISFIVNKIRTMPNPEKAIQYFDDEHIFADEKEKLIVREIVTNPIFKDTFLHYDKIFGIINDK